MLGLVKALQGILPPCYLLLRRRRSPELRTAIEVLPPCQRTTEAVRLRVGGIVRMGTWDYVLAIGAVFVFIFTIVMDVLLVREWIKKRRDKQEPHEPSEK
jgi:hypothetical protein